MNASKVRKYTFILFIGILCVIAFFSLWEVSSKKTNNTSSLFTITELDKPYVGKTIKVTATEIKTTQNPTLSDQMFIGVYFTIENICNEEILFRDSDITAYVDNISTIIYPGGVFGKDLFSTTLIPGKQTSGFFCVNAPKNAKIIELYIEEHDNNKKVAVFTFDIPPIKESSVNS